MYGPTDRSIVDKAYRRVVSQPQLSKHYFLTHPPPYRSLAPNKSKSPAKKAFPTVTLASALGAGVGGILLGAVIALFFLRSRARSNGEYGKSSPSGSQQEQAFGRGVPGGFAQYRAVPSAPGQYLDGSTLTESMSPNPMLVQQYQIEPFTMPSEDGRLSRHVERPPSVTTEVISTPGPRSEPDSQAGSSSRAGQSTGGQHQQVYVVHHDGGRAPVTVYSPDGTEVVELPPGYPGRAATQRRRSISREDVSELPYDRRRHVGPTPRKGGPSVSNTG